MTIAQPRTVPNTRELRALELYRTRGHEIRQSAEDLYLVPSCTGRGFYSVDYREETCDCPDFTHRRENCKHILAVGVHVAKRRHQRPHACMDGWVFLGRVVESEHDLDGEVIEYERVPCRRCNA
jgi:SWIM zinc finger